MSPKTLLAGAAGLVALNCAGAALAETAFQPGVWETKTTFADTKNVETNRHCAKAADVKRDTLEARLAAMTQNPNCKYSQKSIGGGKYAIAGTCNDAGIKSSYRQSGTYTPASMTMNMSMTIAVPGQKPVSQSFTAVSRRVGAVCPAGMTEE